MYLREVTTAPSYQQIVNMVSASTKKIKQQTVIDSFRVSGVGVNGEKIPRSELHTRLKSLIDQGDKSDGELIEVSDFEESDDEVVLCGEVSEYDDENDSESENESEKE